MKTTSKKKAEKATATKAIKKNSKAYPLPKKPKPAPPKPKKVTLRSGNDILAVLEKVLNAYMNFEISEDETKTVAYIMQIPNGVLKSHELEKRLDELENLLEKSAGNQNY